MNENMELVYFKLLNGEEIIAYAKKIIGGWYIENPALLVSMPEYKVGLANWLPYTKLSAAGNIPDASLLLVAEVEDEMIKYYRTWLTQGAPEVTINSPDDTAQSSTNV